jgi:hypothetical protein
MLRFCAFDLELTVDAVLARGTGPALCRARDASGDPWLILQVDDDPAHLSWLCAPVPERAIDAVVEGEVSRAEVLPSSAPGTVQLVVVDGGRAVADRRLSCTDVANYLPADAARPVARGASDGASSAPALTIEVAPGEPLAGS